MKKLSIICAVILTFTAHLGEASCSDKPLLTKTAVLDWCNNRNAPTVAGLIIIDQSCGNTEKQELAAARKVSYGYGLRGLSNLIDAIYQQDAGLMTMQEAADGLCWGINYPK